MKEEHVIDRNKVFKVAKEDLGCSQPFLNIGKYEIVSSSPQEEFPLPVIEINGHYFLTDGHTRAYISENNEIEVYLDEDISESKIQSQAYQAFIKWTQAEGVNSVDDLADRIISEKQFKEIWIKRCEGHYTEIAKEEENEE